MALLKVICWVLIFIIRKDISLIEIRLSSDMKSIAEWCEQNELVLNTTRQETGRCSSALLRTCNNIANFKCNSQRIN